MATCDRIFTNVTPDLIPIFINGRPIRVAPGRSLAQALGDHDPDLLALLLGGATATDARGLPAGGSINWTSGFLPANHQGVPFRTTSREPVVDLQTPSSITALDRSEDMRLLASMNREFAQSHLGDQAFAARLRSYE